MPSTELTAADLTDGAVNIMDLLVKTGLTASKGEGRRLVQQGGISLDGEKVTDFAYNVPEDKLKAGTVIKKGKKVYHKVTLA